jgi:RNA polymerase sigma-70 factor (ECF subfamily)
MANSNYQNARQFLTAFGNGEERGFDYFFKTYYKVLCFFANRYLLDLQAAEDIVSDAYIRVWEKRETIQSSQGLKNYLYKTVHNACIRWLEQKRAAGARQLTIEGGQEAERNVLDNMIRAEVMNEVYKTIDLLPTECRKIFTKLYLEGKTVKEIAEELSLSVSTVKTQKARALDLLRQKLSPLSLLAFLSFCGG